MLSLNERVKEAARNAFDNGYQHWLDTEELALDMTMYDADIEGEELNDVVTAIEEENILERETVGYRIKRPAD